MRLLVANHNIHALGGAEASLRAVLPLLRDRGFDLGVMTFLAGDPGTKGFIPADVEHLSAVGLSSSELVATVEAWRPDVVYSHGVGIVEHEAVLAKHFSTVYYAHNYGGTCMSGTKCHAFPAVQPCSRPLSPDCMALYLPRRCGGLNPFTALRAYHRERRRQQTFVTHRGVLVASRHMAVELVRNGVPNERVHLAPLFPAGIVPDPSSPSSRPQTGRVLFLGRLTALKGWSHLVDALPRAATQLGRPLMLVAVGEGPDRDKFEAAVRRKAIPTKFMGWTDLHRRNAEMRAADVIVVPSTWPEPFGLIGIEAGCVGTPAVAYAVGGIPDWLVSGVSGELAPGERPNPSELADAIVRALADPEHHQHLRVGAWETACRFTPEAHLARLIPILEAAAQS
ncbi:MAG: glycosyltransferase family 4 protein [Planctomycetes bacterium]|nr:glycosyltransferase family 4 protein [Planctomycetota bacterium]